jgi:hypothetical protein
MKATKFLYCCCLWASKCWSRLIRSQYMKFCSHDSMPFPIVTQCEPQITSAKNASTWKQNVSGSAILVHAPSPSAGHHDNIPVLGNRIILGPQSRCKLRIPFIKWRLQSQHAQSELDLELLLWKAAVQRKSTLETGLVITGNISVPR